MTDLRSNHARLSDLVEMPVGEIAGLPAAQLAILQEEAETALDAARRQKEHLDRAIAHRFGDRANAVRSAEGKDTGTVRFEDDGVTVVAVLPKRVEWDQKHLAALAEQIRASGEDPADYVEITLKVAERRYAAWPPALRETFEPARTVKTGKPVFQLLLDAGGNT